MNSNDEPSLRSSTDDQTPIGGAATRELDPRHWEVEVRIDGESVLTIGHSHLAGIPDIDRWQRVVWTCAEHLRSFIGDPDAPAAPCFGCGGSRLERWMGSAGEEVGPCSVCCAEPTELPMRSAVDGE